MFAIPAPLQEALDAVEKVGEGEAAQLATAAKQTLADLETRVESALAGGQAAVDKAVNPRVNAVLTGIGQADSQLAGLLGSAETQGAADALSDAVINGVMTRLAGLLRKPSA